MFVLTISYVNEDMVLYSTSALEDTLLLQSMIRRECCILEALNSEKCPSKRKCPSCQRKNKKEKQESVYSSASSASIIISTECCQPRAMIGDNWAYLST